MILIIEKRNYLTCGFFDSKYITLNSTQVIYDPEVYLFAVLSCKMHMIWTKATAGALESRIRYSALICYNTFPFPDINDDQKSILEQHVFNVLDEREQHSEKTMAQLYDPDKMPAGLRKAHHDMDLAIEQCYRLQTFKSDEERLEYLFKLYETMIAAEDKI